MTGVNSTGGAATETRAGGGRTRMKTKTNRPPASVMKVRDPQRFPEGEECNLSSAAAAEGSSEPDGAVGRARMVRHVHVENLVLTLSLTALVSDSLFSLQPSGSLMRTPSHLV